MAHGRVCQKEERHPTIWSAHHHCTNHFGVTVSDEKETRKAIQTDVYRETTLKQMKFEFKNNTWVKKNAQVVEEMDEEA
jgi:tryptophanase